LHIILIKTLPKDHEPCVGASLLLPVKTKVINARTCEAVHTPARFVQLASLICDAWENVMSEKITAVHIEIEKVIERAKLARVAQLRRYGIALGKFGSKLRAPAIAVVSILLILFGAKVLLVSAATAEANTVPVFSSSWPLP
jgi:hypothetical protein